MKIAQLLTPIAEVAWIAVTDTVDEALVHLETNDLGAAPMLDAQGHYVGTVTLGDLRRHLATARALALALATPIAEVAERSPNPAVGMSGEVEELVAQAVGHAFVPIVDAERRLAGIVERRRILGSGWIPMI